MDDEVWQAFRRTSIRVFTPDRTVDVRPTDGDQPGAYLPDTAGPIHVLTAQNPMGLAATPEANAGANRRLATELHRFANVTIWPVTGYGGGPFDGEGTWREDGFGIEGLSRAEALEIARRYAQRAIFEWRNEAGGFRLIACDRSADEARGWAATSAPTD